MLCGVYIDYFSIDLVQNYEHKPLLNVNVGLVIQ